MNRMGLDFTRQYDENGCLWLGHAPHTRALRARRMLSEAGLVVEDAKREIRKFPLCKDGFHFHSQIKDAGALKRAGRGWQRVNDGLGQWHVAV